MRRSLFVLSLASLTACVSIRHARPDPATESSALPRIATEFPSASGAIILTGIELPDAGTTIGGHYTGLGFEVRQFGYQLSDALRIRWSEAARDRGELLLRAAGLNVVGVGQPSSDAQQLHGVQYGLSGRVAEMSVTTTGPTEPYRVDVQLVVSWELLDIGSGGAVFGRTLRGSVRETGDLDSVIGRALDQSLIHLVADSSFRYALATMRADPDAGMEQHYARDLPASGDVIQLDSADLNPAEDSGLALRVAAGVVTLRTPDYVRGTAFILTRDGLALASARVVRDTRRLRARLRNGIERPIRVIRTNRSLDVALIQIACNTDCETVDWEVPSGVDVFTQVMAISPALNDVDSMNVAFGRIGGHWGMGSGVTLDVPDGSVIGGEPVARTSSGRVFALVSSRPGRRTAVLLSEALGALKVRRS